MIGSPIPSYKAGTTVSWKFSVNLCFKSEANCPKQWTAACLTFGCSCLQWSITVGIIDLIWSISATYSAIWEKAANPAFLYLQSSLFWMVFSTRIQMSGSMISSPILPHNLSITSFPKIMVSLSASSLTWAGSWGFLQVSLTSSSIVIMSLKIASSIPLTYSSFSSSKLGVLSATVVRNSIGCCLMVSSSSSLCSMIILKTLNKSAKFFLKNLGSESAMLMNSIKESWRVSSSLISKAFIGIFTIASNKPTKWVAYFGITELSNWLTAWRDFRPMWIFSLLRVLSNIW